jgi:hypothetical protein
MNGLAQVRHIAHKARLKSCPDIAGEMPNIPSRLASFFNSLMLSAVKPEAFSRCTVSFSASTLAERVWDLPFSEHGPHRDHFQRVRAMCLPGSFPDCNLPVNFDFVVQTSDVWNIDFHSTVAKSFHVFVILKFSIFRFIGMSQ